MNQRIAKGGERGRNPDSSLHGRMLVEQKPTAAQRTAASSTPMPTPTSSATCLLSRTLTPSNPPPLDHLVLPAPRRRHHRPYLVRSRPRARTTAWGLWHHQSVSQERTSGTLLRTIPPRPLTLSLRPPLLATPAYRQTWAPSPSSLGGILLGGLSKS